ncbi:hypothetical protein SAMN05421797_107162 [Maribacter ulvicola]|uniref:Uncharacterized protein n=1 Tax=Maribacter ulvicola TaxID=228959 RepID=A0A1N6YVX0_9FLAO|nr:hypothetical protein SAMN05421797_107162 [Maribacter ulvicola]
MENYLATHYLLILLVSISEIIQNQRDSIKTLSVMWAFLFI